jgi:LPS O-antigen subunit length determinant protein (WzzB/FepE family)
MESGERVIDLLALIRTVLKKWRRMLIFGILFALLSAVYYGVFRNGKAVDVVDSEVSVEDESLNDYAAELEIIDNSIANKTVISRTASCFSWIRMRFPGHTSVSAFRWMIPKKAVKRKIPAKRLPYRK